MKTTWIAAIFLLVVVGTTAAMVTLSTSKEKGVSETPPALMAPCNKSWDYWEVTDCADLNFPPTVYWWPIELFSLCADPENKNAMFKVRNCNGATGGSPFCGQFGSSIVSDPGVTAWNAKFNAGEVIKMVCTGIYPCQDDDCEGCEDELDNCS